MGVNFMPRTKKAVDVENNMENTDTQDRKKRESGSETCISCISGEDFCTVYTTETWCRNRIKEWMEKRPNDVKNFMDYGDGGMKCDVPKSWMMKINPRKEINMTDEKRKAASERMKKAREVRMKNLGKS